MIVAKPKSAEAITMTTHWAEFDAIHTESADTAASRRRAVVEGLAV